MLRIRRPGIRLCYVLTFNNIPSFRTYQNLMPLIPSLLDDIPDAAGDTLEEDVQREQEEEEAPEE